MAVGRVQAALAAATNEVTVAAANLNFDFTLVKYEAPKEYQALGNVLSTKRKDNAEHGSSHITARQLGALFEGVCPATPHLLEAYGTRASEIAKAAKTISEPYINTLFADYTGIDGTSIWAAATSSKSALHIHLLACMLARLWTAPEAVAIWVELIAERKREIANKVEGEEGITFSLAAAVGQQITRPQLAAWDDSARAWLRTADVVQRRNQKQLEIILKNINLSIGGDAKVFSSVVEAWSTAVQTMDKLVAGMPQEVRNGATLLGLSAWHLYPDMSIFGREIVPVKMDDPLVTKGGLLSLGLSATPRTADDSNGVSWSLPLAHLRHYGRPVQTQRTVGTDSRISFPELNLVLFAAFAAKCGLDLPKSEVLAEAILLASSGTDGAHSPGEMETIHFKLLKDGAMAFVDRSGRNADIQHKLIQLGRRRAHILFQDSDKAEINPSVILNDLSGPSVFIGALKDCNARVVFLRHIATKLSGDAIKLDAFLIRYIHDSLDDSAHLEHSEFVHSRLRSGTFHPGDAELSEYRSDGLPPAKRAKHDLSTLPSNKFSFATATSSDDEDRTIISGTSTQFQTLPQQHRWLPRHLVSANIPEGESSTLDAEEQFQSWDHQFIPRRTKENWSYEFVLGDPSSAALYMWRAPRYHLETAITLEDWRWCLKRGLLEPTVLLRILTGVPGLGVLKLDRVRKSMLALAYAAMVYDDLPEVTIDIGILTRPLLKPQWAQNSWDPSDWVEDAKSSQNAFSLISYFESGVHDINPRQLEDIIAVSSANSLFVFKAMIQDPYESREKPWRIQRILGNVGKPGITFLLPPQEPMVREISPHSWKVDPYQPFDGKSANSFKSTSVHLSFTDYHVQMYDGSRGSHDNQISFLESVISVRHEGEWVADIDPFCLIRVWSIEMQNDGTARTSISPLQNLDKQAPCHHPKDSNPDDRVIAVDSWDEVLDTPDGMFVVRTGGNWIARLALAAITVQQMEKISDDFKVTVCPPAVCWTCLSKNYRRHAYIF